MLSFKETFQPFANPTVWLVFAGLVLSLALCSSGLDRALAARAGQVLGGSRLRMLLSLHAMGLAAALLIPSGVVRVLLLVPFGVALLERGRDKGNPLLEATVLLSLVCSTYYGGCGILTGAVPNLVVAGRLEEVTGRVLFWGEWLQWMFPVIGVLRTSLCLGVVWMLFARRLPPSCLETGAQGFHCSPGRSPAPHACNPSRRGGAVGDRYNPPPCPRCT